MTTKLRYNEASEFYDGILHLTMRGLTFEADPTSLTITLLGGF